MQMHMMCHRGSRAIKQYSASAGIQDVYRCIEMFIQCGRWYEDCSLIPIQLMYHSNTINVSLFDIITQCYLVYSLLAFQDRYYSTTIHTKTFRMAPVVLVELLRLCIILLQYTGQNGLAVSSLLCLADQASCSDLRLCLTIT